MGLLSRRTKSEKLAGEAETGTATEVEVTEDDMADDAEVQEYSDAEAPPSADSKPTGVSRRLFVFAVLPVVAAAAIGVAGYFKYQAETAHVTQSSAIEVARVASEGAVALLSYHADSVEKDLSAASERLTGSFREDYEKLTREVVIPGSHEKGISAVASVPAAATVTATPAHAVVLVFVDQNITVGSDPPTSSSSSVRVTMDKLDDGWMISGFEPVG